MSVSTILITCGIFADELQAVVPDGAAEVILLDSALHVDPHTMATQLSLAGEAAREKAGRRDHTIRFLLGSGCHPDIEGLTAACGAPLPPFKNCIEAFAPERQRECASNGTLIITPGWVRAWLGMSSPLGWDATEMRIQHGRYERILLLDPGINPVSEEEILRLFDLIRVPIEVEPLDLSRFRQVLSELLT